MRDGAKAGWNAKQVFEISHPGKVHYYLISDFGDDSCGTLANWAMANAIPQTSLNSFPNAGKPINMSHYGSAGMPKVVVVGNSSHYVYFNKNFSPANDFIGIKNAIAEALIGGAPTGIKEINSSNNQLVLTQKNGKLYYSTMGVSKVAIFNQLGQLVHQGNTNTAVNSISIDQLTKGIYYIKLYKQETPLVTGKFVIE